MLAAAIGSRRLRRLTRAVAARSHGGVAQLGERLLCKQEVIGSIPFTSTSKLRDWAIMASRLASVSRARMEPWIATVFGCDTIGSDSGQFRRRGFATVSGCLTW